MKCLPRLFVFLCLLAPLTEAAGLLEVDSLAALAAAAADSNRQIRLKPGVYRMADYLTPEVLREIDAQVDRTLARPPVPMLVFRGDSNVIDLRGVVLEIDTSLYRLVPQGGYTRCLIVAGNGNRLEGLTIRNVGAAEQGSNGNILSVAGRNNTLEEVTLYVRGSSPYGYGDLLGKGGPNLVPLRKQSGIQVLGSGTMLRRCKVFSRAFGHCFYIQGGEGIRLEDCYAEGAVRSTSDMLADTSGPAFELGFRSVYKNRDGRFCIVPGYTKSLSEDGFRTYGGVGSVTLVNCTAINTRAGFEIGARDDAKTETVVENCVALGCERGYLIGSRTVVRRCRGDVKHGPLLYLRGGRGSDVELELIGEPPEGLVHVLATLAGFGHRVRLSSFLPEGRRPLLPILVGFGMPQHAEMASPIEPFPAEGLELSSALVSSPLLVSEQAKDCRLSSPARILSDASLRKDPGSWGLGPGEIATGQDGKKR